MTNHIEAAKNPGEWLNDVVARVKAVAERTEGYAYEFLRCEDDTLLEVRCEAGEGEYKLTPVDQSGNPLGTPLPDDDGKPYYLHPLPGAKPRRRRFFHRKAS